MKRTVALVSLLFVAVANVWLAATPAGAAGACKRFRPATPDSLSSNAADAKKGKVLLVTEKATEDDPVTIEYAHAPALADESVGGAAGYPEETMVVEDAKFFNFQVVTKARASSVNARIEWSNPSMSDIDLRLYGTRGEQIDYSAAYNPYHVGPMNEVVGGDDAMGMEQLTGLALPRCYGFTVESRPASSYGEPAVSLKVWLD